MTVSAGFLIYAALYRLTVLAVGALAIWLGFRLFNRVGTENKAHDSAGSAIAEGGGFKLRLTSILPGTYFALFGTVIISVMLWKGEPQLSEKQVVQQHGKATVSSETLMRQVDCQVHLNGIVQEWEKLNKFGITLAEAGKPLHQIACYYFSKNRIGEAVAMANLAAQYGKDEDRVKHLDLLAKLLRANGDEEGAAKVEQDAATLRGQEK